MSFLDWIEVKPMKISTGVLLAKYFTPRDCMDNANCLFIYGDNLVKKGYGGQAIIRDMPNAFGILTKRLPTMNDNAFFGDWSSEFEDMEDALDRLERIFRFDRYHHFVFPEDGLGTGLAQMNIHSPAIFQYMNKRINDVYGIYEKFLNKVDTDED